MFELIKASDYYGPHATGWVLLVDGQPMHCGRKKEAQASMNALKASRAPGKC